jgi:hypothetical protein
MTSKDLRMSKQGDAGKRKRVTQKQTLMPLNEQLEDIFVVKFKYRRSNKKLPLKSQISIGTV